MVALVVGICVVILSIIMILCTVCRKRPKEDQDTSLAIGNTEDLIVVESSGNKRKALAQAAGQYAGQSKHKPRGVQNNQHAAQPQQVAYYVPNQGLPYPNNDYPVAPEAQGRTFMYTNLMLTNNYGQTIRRTDTKFVLPTEKVCIVKKKYKKRKKYSNNYKFSSRQNYSSNYYYNDPYPYHDPYYYNHRYNCYDTYEFYRLQGRLAHMAFRAASQIADYQFRTAMNLTTYAMQNVGGAIKEGFDKVSDIAKFEGKSSCCGDCLNCRCCVNPKCTNKCSKKCTKKCCRCDNICDCCCKGIDNCCKCKDGDCSCNCGACCDQCGKCCENIGKCCDGCGDCSKSSCNCLCDSKCCPACLDVCCRKEVCEGLCEGICKGLASAACKC